MEIVYCRYIVQSGTSQPSQSAARLGLGEQQRSVIDSIEGSGSTWAAGAVYLVRFRVNWTSGRFVADAVFPNISAHIGPQGGDFSSNPTVLRQNGDVFVAFQSGPSVYKFRDGPAGPGTVLLPSAGLVKDEVCVPNGNPTHGGKACVTGHDCSNNGGCNQEGKCDCKPGFRGDHCQYGPTCTTQYFVYADANGNGLVEAPEWAESPIQMPAGCPPYFSSTIAADLAILCVGRGTQVYRLPVARFDAHGNPVYAANWAVALTDPFFAAVEAAAAANTTAPPMLGGNEVISKWNTSNVSSPLFNVPALHGNGYTSSWAMVVGDPAAGYYVNARCGGNFNADKGNQHKLSRYGPATDTPPELLWRVGRASLRSDDPPPGEIVASMATSWPALGMVGIVDNSMAGVHIYTEDGLYVDSAFIPGEFEQSSLFGLPGEFFAGRLFHNLDDGAVYAQMGKVSMELFRLRGWTNSTVRTLQMRNQSFQMTEELIGPPSMDALSIRHHGNVDDDVNTAVFRRVAAGGPPPAIDGSSDGWGGSDVNISFWSDGSHHVTTQLLHDDDTIYVRATIRLGTSSFVSFGASSCISGVTCSRWCQTGLW